MEESLPMPRVVKFALKTLEGIEIRDVISLKENFCLPMIIYYFQNGKLIRWLRDHYENDLADKLAEITDHDIKACDKICDIFDVNIDKPMIEKGWEDYQRIERLMACTDNYEYIKNLDDIVFNQEELDEKLIKEGTFVYLCGGYFEIPKDKCNHTFIGINNPKVKTDLINDRNSHFQNILFETIDKEENEKVDIQKDAYFDIDYIKNLELGDFFTFGIYDDKPIEWIVLKKDIYLCAITHKNITKKRMHVNGGYIGWKKTELFQWLNDYFYNHSFSKKQQQIFIKQSINQNFFVPFGAKPKQDLPEVISLPNIKLLADNKIKNIIMSTKNKENVFESGDDLIWLCENGNSPDPRYRASSGKKFQTFSCLTGKINYDGYNRADDSVGVRPVILLDVGLR